MLKTVTLNDNAKQLGTVRIINVLGKIVYQKDISNIQTLIDVQHFSAGVY